LLENLNSTSGGTPFPASSTDIRSCWVSCCGCFGLRGVGREGRVVVESLAGL
jgi:hypothetical protein